MAGTRLLNCAPIWGIYPQLATLVATLQPAPPLRIRLIFQGIPLTTRRSTAGTNVALHQRVASPAIEKGKVRMMMSKNSINPTRRHTPHTVMTGLLLASVAMTTLPAASAEAQQCRDGIDNDFDGRVDALVIHDPLNAGTRLDGQFVIRKFYNGNRDNGPAVPTHPPWSTPVTDPRGLFTGVRSDEATRAKICATSGFPTVSNWADDPSSFAGYRFAARPLGCSPTAMGSRACSLRNVDPHQHRLR